MLADSTGTQVDVGDDVPNADRPEGPHAPGAHDADEHAVSERMLPSGRKDTLMLEMMRRMRIGQKASTHLARTMRTRMLCQS